MMLLTIVLLIPAAAVVVLSIRATLRGCGAWPLVLMLPALAMIVLATLVAIAGGGGIWPIVVFISGVMGLAFLGVLCFAAKRFGGLVPCSSIKNGDAEP